MALSIFVLVAATSTGDFSLWEFPDSQSYRDAARLESPFDHVRTVGYPLLLATVSVFDSTLAVLPTVQLVLCLMAIGALWVALGRFGVGPQAAFAVVVPMLLDPMLVEFSRWLLTESLAQAMLLATCAALLLVVATPGRSAPWLWLGGTLTVSYLVRPSSLYLLVAIPAIGLMLCWLHDRSESRRRLLLISGGIAAIAWVPFLLFSLLRLLLVGHFGLVSFGGINVAGVVAPLIDENVIERLPVADRELATAILERRRARGLETIQERRARGASDRMVSWTTEYNTSAWLIATPAAHALAEQCGDGPAQVAINRRLSSLGRAVVWAEPALYLEWVCYHYRRGLIRPFRRIAGYSPWSPIDQSLVNQRWWQVRMQKVASFGLGALIVCLLIRLAIRRLVATEPSVAFVWWDRSEAAPLVIAAVILMASLALISLVEPTAERYVHGGAVFVPGALLSAAWMQARRLADDLRRARPRRRRSAPA